MNLKKFTIQFWLDKNLYETHYFKKKAFILTICINYNLSSWTRGQTR